MPKHVNTVPNASAGRSFAELLREYRIAAGITQERLAERARMSAVTIRALERGVRKAPRRETISLISQALEVDEERRAALEEAAESARARSRRPAAREADTGARLHHIPIASTSIVGRDEEIDSIIAGLAQHRIVTLTGSGGIGKTRVALEVARRISSAMWDDVYFTDLTPLSAGALIAGQVASAVDPSLSGKIENANDLAAQLADRRLLLILDNCEHLIGDAAAVAHAIVATCPQITILATSRERLQVSLESVHRLPSLTLPDRAPPTLEEAARYSAIDLFLQRSRRRDPSITFANDSVGFLFNICRRLEGIPLAIELAVARLPFFGLKTLDARLEEHFSLPGAPRDLPRRQQTMEATIAWSFDLLTAAERALLARLAIFVGGFTLDAAQSVCAGGELDGASVLRVLASLADKSLVEILQKSNTVRYVLLESVRAFAFDQLGRFGMLAPIARAHALWLARIENGRPHSLDVMSPEDVLEFAPDLDNARAAVTWALNAPDDDDRALAGNIIVRLRDLWIMHGQGSELRRLIIASLERIDEAKYPHVAAKILHYYIISAFNEPDVLVAIERAIPLFDRLRDARETMALHSSLTFIFAYRGLIAQARSSAERVEAIVATENNYLSHEFLSFLHNRAMLREIEMRFDDARADVAEAESIASALDYDTFTIRRLKKRLIFIESSAGDLRRAIEVAHEMLADELGANSDVIRMANECLAMLHLLLDEADAAEVSARVVLDVARSDESLIVQYIAGVAALRGNPHVAARLMGFVEALLERIPSQRDSLQQRQWDALCASVSKQLNPDVMALLRAEGRNLTPRDAGAEASAALDLPTRAAR